MKEKRENKKLNNTIITLIIEVLYIIVIELLFRNIFGNPILDWATVRIVASSFLIGGVLTLITVAWKPVFRNILLCIVDLFMAVYAWVQLGFFDFLGAFISLGSAEQGTKVTDYIGDFLVSINTKDYLLFIPFIIILFYFILERYILKSRFNTKVDFNRPITYVCIVVYFVLFSFIFYSSIEAPFMQNKYQTVSNKELYRFASNPAVAIKNYGTNVFLMLDIKGAITKPEIELDGTISSDNKVVVPTIKKPKNDYTRVVEDDNIWRSVASEETNKKFVQLNNYFLTREITEKNSHTGIFKGKNLIFVMLESVALSVFDEQYSEYYPTLYKMYTEGISGINNYSPKNNCATGESEMTSHLSLYSMPTTCTVNTYKNNTYPEAILNVFKNNGYYTSSYHDYTDQYYYRHTFEPNFGANKFYGVDDLKMSWKWEYKEWPSDVTFVKKTLPKFIDEDKFASYMITVTSHAPYMYSSEWGDEYLSLFKGLKVDTATKRYLSKIKIVDLALEEMLKELEEKGKLEDTVIVLFGDHYPYALSQKEFQSISSYKVDVNQEIDRTPFIIYNSGTTPETITKITTPLDYTPTLLNLFGIDYDPRVYLGHDVFSNYESFAVFPDNSWLTSMGFYNAAKQEFKPSSEENVATDEYVLNMNKQVSELRNISSLAIKNNYFKDLYAKIDKKKKELEEKKKAEELKKQQELQDQQENNENNTTKENN